MPIHHYPLTDVAGGLWHDHFSRVAGPDLQLAGSNRWSVRKHTLRGGVSDGVDVVELDNGRLSLAIVPTRGMGIWRGTCDALELGWKSPVELPVHPAFIDPGERGGLGWLAGFNEWICRCGLEVNGAPSPEGPLHGKIANIPAHSVDIAIDTAGQGTIEVTGVMDEATLFGTNLRLKSTVRTEAGSNRFTIIDEITNRRGVPGELELLYHINTGRPFLEPGARCVAPTIEVAPRDPRAAEGIDAYESFAAPTAGYSEQVYFYELTAGADSQTTVLLRNAHGDKGISLHYDRRQLPHFTLWKNTAAEEDGYVTGLEPATNFPNAKAFERKQGRVPKLPPGGTYVIRLDVSVHSSADGVRQVEAEIAALQRGKPPQVHRQPLARWSPL